MQPLSCCSGCFSPSPQCLEQFKGHSDRSRSFETFSAQIWSQLTIRSMRVKGQCEEGWAPAQVNNKIINQRCVCLKWSAIKLNWLLKSMHLRTDTLCPEFEDNVWILDFLVAFIHCSAKRISVRIRYFLGFNHHNKNKWDCFTHASFALPEQSSAVNDDIPTILWQQKVNRNQTDPRKQTWVYIGTIRTAE